MSDYKISKYLGIESLEDNNLVLKKIHFKRLKNSVPNYIVRYCEIKYLQSNDVRFFNELLWLVGGNINVIKRSFQKFNSNYLDSKYKHNYDEEIFGSEYLLPDPIIDKSIIKSVSVALIGNPIHFIIPFYYFLMKSKKVDIINVKYHPHGKLNRILNSSLANLIFRLLFGKSYTEIPINSKADLKSVKLPRQYDVGFHKLSFIIKSNLIDSFRKGLINDHWGRLPFLKGRSTLQYSKLFGIDPLITNHLINKDIDNGDIICFTSLKNNNQKLNIFFGLYKRIYRSILLLASGNIKEINNKQGVMFYEMHPWIIDKLA